MPRQQKILLVDDNQQLLGIYTEFFKVHDYSVAVAHDGEEALEQAKKFKPDLIFLDVMMPKKDGVEVLQTLRQKPEYNCSKARIILLTNLGDSAKVSPDVQKNMDGFVIKAEIVLSDLLELAKTLTK